MMKNYTLCYQIQFFLIFIKIRILTASSKHSVVRDTILSPHCLILPSLVSSVAHQPHSCLEGLPMNYLPPRALCCIVLVMYMQYYCQVKGRTGNMSFKFFTQGLT